jgi:translation initiation factor IF-3
VTRPDDGSGATGPRTNERIRVREVRLIDSNGQQVGIVATHKALEQAQGEGLDLVEVSPTARPPVCKIMDFGKYKYEQNKKAPKTHQTKLKTIRLRPKTDPHILGIRVNQIRDFIAQGDRVSVEVRFRGREMAHQDIGRKMLSGIITALADVAKCEGPPRTEGKNMGILLSKK